MTLHACVPFEYQPCAALEFVQCIYEVSCTHLLYYGGAHIPKPKLRAARPEKLRNEFNRQIFRSIANRRVGGRAGERDASASSMLC